MDSNEVEMVDKTVSASISAVTTLASNENPSNKDLMDVLLDFKSKIIATDAKLSQHIVHTAKQFQRIDKEIANQNSVSASNVSELNDIRGKIDDFANKSEMLSYSVELNKQQNIKNNITIAGVPYTEEENLNALALAACKHVGANVSSEDIHSSYRLKFGSMFVVKFVNFETKAAVMELKANKSIMLEDIIGASSLSSNENRAVYINTHLIPFFGHILSHGRRSVKEKLIHSCWMSNNGVVVKCKADSKETIVKSVSQLNELCGKSNITESSAKTKNKNSLNITATGKRNAANLETSPIDKTTQQKKTAIMAQGKTQVLQTKQGKK